MNFNLGLTGLQAAQRSIELIGTNISNVATEGYHRQDAIISPYATDRVRGVPIGGAQVTSYRRSIDSLLEDELLHQRPQSSQLSQELMTLQSLQAGLGDLDSQALSNAMDGFFGALGELAADPASQALRQQVVWAADSLAAGFRHLGGVIQDLDDQALVESRITVELANNLAGEIANLNSEIEGIVIRGGNANLLVDERDQRISELSDLVELTVRQRSDGSNTVDVFLAGSPLVLKDQAFDFQVDPLSDDRLGLTAKGSISYETDIHGGKLGGLFSLRNDLLAEIEGDLDNLAAQMVREINRLHLQGVGAAGSHESLTGTAHTDPDATLSTWPGGVSAGTMRLRLVDPAGQVTVHTVDIDPDTDTLNSVATAIGALDPAHVSTSVLNGRLHLESLAGWRFDFLPAAALRTGAPWTGTSAPSAGGIYTAPANETFTMTVQGGGRVGVDTGLTVEVRNGAGDLVSTLNVGEGYAAGEKIEIYEGLEIAFGTGTLMAGEQLEVDAVADADPTGFLAEAGMATLFQGHSAVGMAVRQDILDDPRRLATARGTDMDDNAAVRRMAELGEEKLPGLGDAAVTDFYRLLVTGIGQKVALRQVRQQSLEAVLQQLENQRDATSGVDINEEAAKLLVFEKMFQSMAKLLQSQQRAMDTMIELL